MDSQAPASNLDIISKSIAMINQTNEAGYLSVLSMVPVMDWPHVVRTGIIFWIVIVGPIELGN